MLNEIDEKKQNKNKQTNFGLVFIWCNIAKRILYLMWILEELRFSVEPDVFKKIVWISPYDKWTRRIGLLFFLCSMAYQQSV